MNSTTMYKNQKLLKAKRVFLLIYLLVNCGILTQLILGLLNRFFYGQLLDSRMIRIMGTLMATFIVLSILLTITYTILLIVWHFRANHNIKIIDNNKCFGSFWLWGFAIIPLFNAIFPFIFVQRYLRVMKSKFNMDLRKTTRLSWFFLASGIVSMSSLIMLALIINSLEHRYFYLFSIALITRSVFLILELSFYFLLLKRLLKIDSALNNNNFYLDEGPVIDN